MVGFSPSDRGVARPRRASLPTHSADPGRRSPLPPASIPSSSLARRSAYATNKTIPHEKRNSIPKHTYKSRWQVDADNLRRCGCAVLLRLAIAQLRKLDGREPNRPSILRDDKLTYLSSGLSKVLYVSFGLQSYHRKSCGKLSQLSRSVPADIFTPLSSKCPSCEAASDCASDRSTVQRHAH